MRVEFRFPARRYHATPWDAHVNEGRVEWPPSPWRVARSLVACWYRKARADIDEETMQRLVQHLCASLPSYRLPHSDGAHTRHYMPIAGGKTTKVFDTFAQISRDDPIVMEWPELELDEPEKRALKMLLRRLGYLGRAESWVNADLVDAGEGDSLPVVPRGRAASDAAGTWVRTLAPMSAADYEGWRNETLDVLTQAELERMARKKGTAIADVKLTKRQKQNVEALIPATLFDAIHMETGDWHRVGWDRPPGSQWVDYLVPDEKPSRPLGTVSKPRSVLATVARYAVASQVPPRLTNAVGFADAVHKCLMKHSDGRAVFAGREGDRIMNGHRHAHVMCEANGRHGGVTHVTVYAPMGFDAEAREALERFSGRGVWDHSRHDAQLVLLGVGAPEDFAGWNTGAGQCALLVESTRWVSRTPFVPTRYRKRTKRGEPKLDERGLQIGSPEHDLRRLLAGQRLPPVVSAQATSGTDLTGDGVTTPGGGREVSWLEFRVVRPNGGGVRSAARGYGFQLEFAEPVRGPIAVGYGAHFGLGLFAPVQGRP